MIIDRYELFGTHPISGERHSLGTVQVDRAEMDDSDRRVHSFNLFVQFAIGRRFTDGSVATIEGYELASTYDGDRQEYTYERQTEPEAA